MLFRSPVVKQHMGGLNALKDETGIEGVVVRFDDGQMFKIKTEWYVAIHKAKENILFEKNVIKLILEERLDDIIQELPDSDVERITQYQETLLDNIDKSVLLCQSALKSAEGQDKKYFAINIAPKLIPILRVACFACWNNPENIRDSLILNILKKTSTQSEVDSIRDIIGGKW